jgi:dGTPase
MRRPGSPERQKQERRLLEQLAEAIADGAPDTLDRALRPAWQAGTSAADRLRVVVDQVAQLTDTSARERHARLVGPD